MVSYGSHNQNEWVRICNDAIEKSELLYDDGKRGSRYRTLQHLKGGRATLALEHNDMSDVQYTIVDDFCNVRTRVVPFLMC